MKITKKYPFTTLVLCFYALGYLSTIIQCFSSPYCFIWDLGEFTPVLFYSFMMLSAELYHNKGKIKRLATFK